MCSQDCYLCKGARITDLHPCCTTSRHLLQKKQINSIVAAWNLQQLLTCCKQISIHCRVVTWLRMSTTFVMSSSGSKIKLPSMKRRRNTLLPHKKSQASHKHAHASTTDCFSVFLILTIMPRPKHFQAFPDIFQVICSIRTTSHETG